jgi:hypothetical protein
MKKIKLFEEFVSAIYPKKKTKVIKKIAVVPNWNVY